MSPFLACSVFWWLPHALVSEGIIPISAFVIQVPSILSVLSSCRPPMRTRVHFQPTLVVRRIPISRSLLFSFPFLFFLSSSFLLLLHYFFFKTGSLCWPGCPAMHYVDQAVLELRVLLAYASQMLALWQDL